MDINLAERFWLFLEYLWNCNFPTWPGSASFLPSLAFNPYLPAPSHISTASGQLTEEQGQWPGDQGWEVKTGRHSPGDFFREMGHCFSPKTVWAISVTCHLENSSKYNLTLQSCLFTNPYNTISFLVIRQSYKWIEKDIGFSLPCNSCVSRDNVPKPKCPSIKCVDKSSVTRRAAGVKNWDLWPHILTYGAVT